MNRKYLMLLTVAALVMMSVLLLVGAVLAAPITGDNICGEVVKTESGLYIKKDVFCEMDKVWTWDITKTVDESSLTLSTGQQHTVNYTVTASAAAETSNFGVSGNIRFRNVSSESITILSVGDSLAPVTCPVTFPHTLPAGWTVDCTYSGSLGSAAEVNVATVTTSSGAVSATVPIDWTKASMDVIDECAMVTDSFAGTLGNVCAGATTSFTFTYPRTIGPYDVCGEYTVNNTASFVTNDTGSSGSDGAVVNVSVPCEEDGCTLTPGYWKTHSSFGPAPYDSTWALIGENTPFFFSGQSYYQVLWTSPSGGNAYYILAHAYIAAKLNQLNGADFSAAQTAFDQATALFSNPTNTPAYVGGLRGAARNTWINLATILDNYNNGLIGPGHCD